MLERNPRPSLSDSYQLGGQGRKLFYISTINPIVLEHTQGFYGPVTEQFLHMDRILIVSSAIR